MSDREEQTVALANKFYEFRKTMRQLLTPAQYAEQTDTCQRIIAAVMKRDNLNHVQAALRVLKSLSPETRRDTLVVPLVASAMLDMVEAGDHPAPR